MFFFLKYQIRRTTLINNIFNSNHFWKTLFSKKIPNFWRLATNFVYKKSKFPFGMLIFFENLTNFGLPLGGWALSIFFWQHYFAECFCRSSDCDGLRAESVWVGAVKVIALDLYLSHPGKRQVMSSWRDFAFFFLLC